MYKPRMNGQSENVRDGKTSDGSEPEVLFKVQLDFLFLNLFIHIKKTKKKQTAAKNKKGRILLQI